MSSKKKAGSRCCRCGCRAHSCCGWPTGSWPRCCSNCHREGHAPSLFLPLPPVKLCQPFAGLSPSQTGHFTPLGDTYIIFLYHPCVYEISASLITQFTDSTDWHTVFILDSDKMVALHLIVVDVFFNILCQSMRLLRFARNDKKTACLLSLRGTKCRSNLLLNLKLLYNFHLLMYKPRLYSSRS